MKTWLTLLLLFWVGWCQAQNVKTYIPEKAPPLFPAITEARDRYFTDLPSLNKVPALIEQESCIHLKHKRCFDASSELKTARERGVGLGQTTIAYNPDGSVRFDTIQEMKRAHYQELRELSWSNIVQRPDLQIRFIFLKLRDNYQKGAQSSYPEQQQIFAFSAYNQGQGAVIKDQRVCRLTKGCDPNVWFDNVELYCTRSKRPIYGNRSACDITREHTHNVFKVRWMKYAPYFNN